MDHKDNISASIRRLIDSLDDQQVAILLGCDDQAKLWLNGECIYESKRGKAAMPDEDAIAANPRADWNSILVRVANKVREHELDLRLSDAPADLVRSRNHAD